jgi:hypothetical protein
MIDYSNLLKKGYLNGQARGDLCKMYYGSGVSRSLTVNNTGCGPVSIYNMAKMLGHAQTLQKIIFELEFNEIYLNKANWGTDPWKIPKYFKAHGMKTKGYSKADIMKKKIKSGGKFLMFYWTGHGQEAHVVAMNAQKNSSITVYNNYNTDENARNYSSVENIFSTKTKTQKGKKKTYYKIFREGSFIQGYKVGNK